MDRRGFVATLGGVSLAATAGCLFGGDDPPEEPEYGEFFQGVPNFEGFVDRTDEDPISVIVGAGENGLLFDPPAIIVGERTTVVWEWSGLGGEHNVEAVEAPGEEWSNPAGTIDQAGHEWSREFTTPGTHLYYCWPHRSVMKGGIFVDAYAADTAQVDTDGARVDDDEVDTPAEPDATGEADIDQWLDRTANYQAIVDRTDRGLVDVTVGAGQNGVLFDPPAIRILAGTDVRWTWSGEGGAHSVESVQTPGEAWSNPVGLVEADGLTFEREFSATGVHLYECRHHTGVGMRGAIVVE